MPMEELEKVLERARKEPLDQEGYAKLKASLETLGYLVQLVENKDTTIHRLPASWGTAGQQHRRANAEDGYSSSEERAVLQDSERRSRGRPVHESHLHLPTLRRQPFRLLDRVAETPSRAIPDTLGVDALELPGNTGAKIEL